MESPFPDEASGQNKTIFPFFDKLVLILILVLTSILRVLQNTPTGWTITNSLKYTRAYGKSNSNELGFDLADNSLSSNIKSLQAFSKKKCRKLYLKVQGP